LYFIFISPPDGFTEEGFSWGRFRMLPKLSLSESYTDNVFLTLDNKQYDLITTLAPQLCLDVALTPESNISLQYDGTYTYHRKADNFRNDIHRAGVKGSFTTQKGSVLSIGAKAGLDSIQPYSSKGDHKDFTETDLYSDMIFKLQTFTDISLKYHYVTRRFKDSNYSYDDFNLNAITLNLQYGGFPAISPVIEYTFNHQNNEDINQTSQDFNTHVFLIGAQWDPEARLSGYLKGGYYYTKLKYGDTSNGFALDSDIAYQITDILKMKLKGFRRVVSSTISARESGNYYVSTGGKLSFIHKMKELLTLTANFSYTHNKFNQFDNITTQKQIDKLFMAGLNATYQIQEWLSLTLLYAYRFNNSNYDEEYYKENRLEMRALFSL
jgi:hypothetical protein